MQLAWSLPYQGIESVFPLLWTCPPFGWFWPVKYSRDEAVLVLGIALNWVWQLLSLGSQTAPKSDKCEITMLWEVKATWRGSKGCDARWKEREKLKVTETPDLRVKKPYWKWILWSYLLQLIPQWIRDTPLAKTFQNLHAQNCVQRL